MKTFIVWTEILLTIGALVLAGLWFHEYPQPARAYDALIAGATLAIALLEFLRRSEKSTDVARLIDEAAFVMTARWWPGNEIDAERVEKELREHLQSPVLVGRRRIARALRKAERCLNKVRRSDSPFDRVKCLLEPVLAVLPSERQYLDAIARTDPQARVSELTNGYHKTLSTGRGDFWAWNYLLLMDDLGARTALLSILRERLIALHKQVDAKAYDATDALARKVLRDEYPAWFEREVRKPDQSA